MGNFLLILIVSISAFVVAVSGLWVQNCYEYGTLPIEVRSMSLSPSTLHIPGVSRLTFDLMVRDIVGTAEVPLKARVSLAKVVAIGFGWLRYTYEVPVPCLPVGDGIEIGSCDYEDVCLMVSELNAMTNNTHCAQADYYGLPCNCPVESSRYRTGNKRPIRLDLTQGIDQIPEAVTSILGGEYVATVEVMSDLTDNFSDLLGCFEAEFSMSFNG